MLNIFVFDEIQNYSKCDSKDILKTGRGLTIKLSKNVLCFMYFYLIS